MSRGINSKTIAPIVLSGMQSAAKSWNDLHGTSALKAPEYWFTVTVAQKLQKNLDSEKKWIRLESRVKEVVSGSGAKRRGAPKKGLRRNGRCDLIVERANEKPFAAIEIKSRTTTMKSGLGKDAARLLSLLSTNGVASNSISICCLALYAESSAKNKATAKKSIEGKFDRVVREVSDLCRDARIKVTQIRKITMDTDSSSEERTHYWGVLCVSLCRS